MSDPSRTPESLPRGTMWLPGDTPSSWPSSSSVSDQPIDIVILDSSFNPPHLAHLAFTSNAPPQAAPRLLLFSLTNVEKVPSPSDPSLAQRLHMMSLLAARIPHTAIGLINEPTFAGKSTIIHSYLSSRSIAAKLHFVIGTDTLTRFFDPRFYQTSAGGMAEALGKFFDDEDSTLISACRGGDQQRELEQAVLSRDEVKRWAEAGKVRLLGTGTESWADISSTAVRNAVKESTALDQLVPPEIAEYIAREGLYGD